MRIMLSRICLLCFMTLAVLAYGSSHSRAIHRRFGTLRMLGRKNGGKNDQMHRSRR